ncbi:MAG TPA: tRNA pseudouridine(55) synthase TruB, partial [Nitrospiria bacterium]|nr:tRNA pseudouridine(55) synthase TruB [Nitrospiria bacterium]
MDGFININKPAGWTSHDVVARLRTLLKIKKIGHTGTLDPQATGVLPVCVGKATKLADFLSGADKVYTAVLRLGETTDTLDAEGRVLETRPVDGISDERIRQAAAGFRGEIQQTPPMFSAVKINGQPLYKAARAGKEVSRPSRTVSIHSLDLLARDGRDVRFRVACSKGTYIRTLCADIGERLGVGGHLKELVREQSGPFFLKDAQTLEAIEGAVKAGRMPELLLSPGQIFKEFPGVTVNSGGARLVRNGGPIRPQAVDEWPKEFRTGQHVLVYTSSGRLIALAEALVSKKEFSRSGKEEDSLNKVKGRLEVFKVEKV